MSHWKSLHSNFEIFWFETFEVEAMTNMSLIQMNYLAMKQNFALEKYFPYPIQVFWNSHWFETCLDTLQLNLLCFIQLLAVA